MISVVATVAGYYGHYRNPGDEFDIDDEKEFSKTWMKKIGKKSPEPVKEVVVINDKFTEMDKEALILFGKANCPDKRLKRTMSEDTMRTRLRERLPE